MEVRFPSESRKRFPAESEIREILSYVCTECGLDPKFAAIDLEVGNIRGVLGKKGFRVLEINPFGLKVAVAGSNDTAKGFFSVRGDEGRNIPGSNLLQLIVDRFDGRIVDMLHLPKTEPELQRGITQDLPAKVVPNLADEVSEHPAPIGVALTNPEVVESVKAQQPKGGYKTYMDDPRNFHLTVVALVALCEEDTSKIFGFSLFKKALEDSNVPADAPPAMVLVRTFALRGMMVRLNHGTNPARYQITQAALDLASGSIPSRVPKTHRSLEPKVPRIPEISAPAVPSSGSTVDDVRELKRKAGLYEQALPKAMEIRESLTELREQLAVLQGKISVHETELASVEDIIQDPAYQAASTQLAELRSIMQ